LNCPQLTVIQTFKLSNDKSNFIPLFIGFIIGLLPVFRGLFSKQVDALRYLPLTALTGMFIIWFGIEDQMKIAFFGFWDYCLPPSCGGSAD